MTNRLAWAGMLLALAPFVGAAVWLAQVHLPSASRPATDAMVAVPTGRAVSLGDVRFVAMPDGRILRFAPSSSIGEPVVSVPGGPVRLVRADKQVFASYETSDGRALLRQIAPEMALPRPLKAAASTLLGLPDGSVWIGGVDGSLSRVDEDTVIPLDQRLPTWVRFLRHDRAGVRIVAISADGSRLEIDLSSEEPRAGAPQRDDSATRFALHAVIDPSEPDGLFPPGYVFRDCPQCPEMVVVPSGSFSMGSPITEKGRYRNEGPQTTIEVSKFAIGKYEITQAEWEVCVQLGICQETHSERDTGYARARSPVTNVSWEDAQIYVLWLSQFTGRSYKLPTEVEWEYAARAGTRTAFSFGSTIDKNQAQFNSSESTLVGSFPANPWGLHDMHGNVWEWTSDCYFAKYVANQPRNQCALRTLRGGSWVNVAPEHLRSSYRIRGQVHDRNTALGFRVVRDRLP